MGNIAASWGISPVVGGLLAAGLLHAGEDGAIRGEMFRERVTFPITDRRGRICGFGALTLGDNQPKYLNGPETPVFSKRRLLYNRHRAAERRRKARERRRERDDDHGSDESDGDHDDSSGRGRGRGRGGDDDGDDD